MTDLFTCVVIGDLHLKVSNADRTGPLLENIIMSVTELNPDFVFVLGDILDSHGKIDMNSQVIANRFLLKLSELSHTYVIIGNHDRINNSEFLTDMHPFHMASKLNAPVMTSKGKIEARKYDLTIIDKPRVIRIDDDNRIVLCPYVAPGRFDEALSKIEKYEMKKDIDKMKLVIAHQEFRGCDVGNSIKSTKGDQWPSNRPLVISGHIHKHHQPQPNIFYAGTPYQLNYDDVGDKGIFFFKFYEKTFEHVMLDMKVPKKHTIIVNPGKLPLMDTDIEDTRFIIEDGSKVSKQWIDEAKKNGHKVIIKKDASVMENLALKSYRDIVNDLVKDDPMARDVFMSIL